MIAVNWWPDVFVGVMVGWTVLFVVLVGLGFITHSDRTLASPDQPFEIAPQLNLGDQYLVLTCPSYGCQFSRSKDWIDQNRGNRVICPKCGDVHRVPPRSIREAVDG